MHEYTPNRFECCDRKLRFDWAFCPICATRIPRVEDTEWHKAERKRLERLKCATTNSTGHDAWADELEQKIRDGFVAPRHVEDVENQIRYARKLAATWRRKAKEHETPIPRESES